MSKNFYIKLSDGLEIPVTKEVHEAYYEQEKPEKYHERMKKKMHKSYDELSETDHPAEGQLFVPPASVEELAEREMTLEILLCALEKITAEEKKLMVELYLAEKTETECAKNNGVSVTTVARRREKILAKLRKLMDRI